MDVRDRRVYITPNTHYTLETGVFMMVTLLSREAQEKVSNIGFIVVHGLNEGHTPQEIVLMSNCGAASNNAVGTMIFDLGCNTTIFIPKY